MNKFNKIKNFIINSNYTEDSSDYVNSDIEITCSTKTNIADDSSDSLTCDRDNDSSSSLSFLQLGDKRLKTSKSSHKQIDHVRLAECLDYLHRMVGRKDKEDIFGLPVTDDIAPGYSTIIKNPMDLGLMRNKIDSHAYNSIVEYRNDLILMCENCMIYNKSDTIYYQAARKMLDYGLKLLSKEKLNSMRNTVRILRYLTPSEFGFEEGSGDLEPSPQLIRKRAEQYQQKSFCAPYTSRLGPNNSIIISKNKLLLKSDLAQNDSFIVPPEGQDVDEDITEKVKEIAALAAQRLTEKNPHGQMGFLKRNKNGCLSYNFIKNSAQIKKEENNIEKTVSIGNLSEGLQPNSYSMTTFIEDKKNSSKPMHFVENGPFGSHAPTYDASYSSLSKEETDVLLTTYGDETAYQYALSFMEFKKDTGVLFNRYVNLVLNSLTNNEHEKYLQYLTKKQNQELHNDTKQETDMKIEPTKAHTS
ncbi:bromodomain-containing 7 isoform X2 [Brachionus plicatilis]|uniref:Bromodomain-containing 7 isoform X2 n=1 Tax=Brachionus plicatilis TaxID=10195 RepID=A0A3M7T4E9_BRAPC|nr:bromodomain-containing 7 isoform X2 [Brachionus plicatilis]